MLWKQILVWVHLFSLSFDEWNFSHFSFVLVSWKRISQFFVFAFQCCASFSYISMDFGSRVFGKFCHGWFCCCRWMHQCFPRNHVALEEMHRKKYFLALTEHRSNLWCFFSNVTKELHWMAKIFGAFPNQDNIFAQQHVGNFLIWMMEMVLTPDSVRFSTLLIHGCCSDKGFSPW